MQPGMVAVGRPPRSIVVIIGVCLCLIELRYLSGRNGVRSSGDAQRNFNCHYSQQSTRSSLPVTYGATEQT